MDKGKNVNVVGNDGINNTTSHGSIKILLMDINAESCEEAVAFLCKFPYQVIPIWQDDEMYETLSLMKGTQSDIILAEVSILMANGGQMLKYIMHKKELKRIPVIMLSTRDQVSLVMKGLKLGAADYLMKPLHATDFSSIWMHIQKRTSFVLEKVPHGSPHILNFLYKTEGAKLLLLSGDEEEAKSSVKYVKFV